MIVTSVVNTPDFFARAKAYEFYKVFVACEGGRIIGSAACALRDAVVNGKISRVGYAFQTFVSPDARRKGIASQLLQQRENYLKQQGAVLVYTLIIESNLPSMRYIESQGYKLHRTLVTSALMVRKEMDIPSVGRIRPSTFEDLGKVSELLNETWQGFELYEPTSAVAMAQFIDRTPTFNLENLLLLEDQGEILACLGVWNWDKVKRITVEVLNLKIRMMGFFLTATRILPEFLKPGDILRQIALTSVGFKDVAHLAVLVRYVNNQALLGGIQQIFSICERNHELLRSMKGLIRVDASTHLYLKPLQENVLMSDGTIFINGIDM